MLSETANDEVSYEDLVRLRVVSKHTCHSGDPSGTPGGGGVLGPVPGSGVRLTLTLTPDPEQVTKQKL